MKIYTNKGKPLDIYTTKELEKAESIISKQGFSNILEYTLFYGFKNCLEAIKSINN